MSHPTAPSHETADSSASPSSLSITFYVPLINFLLFVRCSILYFDCSLIDDGATSTAVCAYIALTAHKSRLDTSSLLVRVLHTVNFY